MRKVLIVVDMQNDFVAEDGVLSSQAARAIVPFVKERVRKALEAGEEVVFTLDTHLEDDLEFDKFAPHCIKGSWGHELIPELGELLRPDIMGQVHFVEKNRYSAFFQTDLEDYLGLGLDANRQRVDEVELVGVCTNICVYFTGEELANRDVKTSVSEQGVASFDLEAHHFAPAQMKSVLGIEVL